MFLMRLHHLSLVGLLLHLFGWSTFVNLIKDNSRNYSDFTAAWSHFDLNFFAKMDRDYLTTFMMLVTLSVIFIVNDDSFAPKEFVF